MTTGEVSALGIVWNPLDARSPIRSSRVQGAVAVLVALVGNAFGVSLPEELTAGFLNVANDTLAQVGTLVLAVGACRAKNSARPF
jgi:hypothetical protein